ncbi:TAR DNA-binding protein 43-like [Anopheles bellator]|uniref:TAR DNA-binding protein 43-like n=1 Tax=Anopheles bellator TaxID=139047 RepID=UPI00264891F8|nr:TAR DNA-binding protein 43-like [Anopheles bellator]XP_058054875.1 TAR DNA-binding protein 43-like [Anopheles bellator]
MDIKMEPSGTVLVSEEEGDEAVEIPLEDDSTLLLTTLQAQFFGACGLKYRNPENKVIRGVRLSDGKLHPFSPESGWGNHVYICVFPKENKRKCDDRTENSTPKTKRIESRNRTTTDLIVLGLPWKTTEERLREYFESFGELLVVQLKKDSNTGQSKGYGFIRFARFECQMKVLSKRHLIDSRWCDVKVPSSKDQMQHQMPSKIFLGRLTEDINADDIRTYFSKYGEVADVFIPKPFRAFAFVTFIDPHVAQSLCGEDHLIKSTSVYVSTASPRPEHGRHRGKSQMGGNPSSSYGGGGGEHAGRDGNEYGGGPHHGGHPNNNYHHGGAAGGPGGYNHLPQAGGGNQRPVWNYNEYTTQNRQNSGNIDSMPNLQALGLNSTGPNGQGGGGGGGSASGHHGGGSMGNHLSGSGGAVTAAPGPGPHGGPGAGNMNINQMPINPAIIAAALSQWSLIGNQMQQTTASHSGGGGPGGPGQGHAGGPGGPAGGGPPGPGGAGPGPGPGQEYLAWNGNGSGAPGAAGPAGRVEPNRP